MAEPFDSAVTLNSITNALQEQYFNRALDVPAHTGRVTNRLFQLDSEPVVGDGKTFQTKRAIADTFRATNDALSDFPLPNRYQFEKIKARWNERNPSSHDFTKLHGSCRVSEYELRGVASEGSIVDIVQTLERDMKADFDFKLALKRRQGRTAVLGNVNGTRKNADAREFASCTAYTNGSSTMRAQVDECSIAWFRDGQKVDFYTSAGALVLANCQIVGHPNVTDNSVAFQAPSGSNFDSIADNNVIYLTGEKDKGMYSVESWFTRPTAGESWIGGVDRSTITNQYLLPLLFREDSSLATVRINKSHLDDAFQAISYAIDAEQDTMYNVVMQTNLFNSLRAQYDQATFIVLPLDDSRRERYQKLGSSGVMFSHPTVGTVMLEADPFMPPGVVDLMKFGDWRTLAYGKVGLVPMPGTFGSWSRMPSAVAGSTYGMFYSTEAYANVVDYCLNPAAQGRIKRLSAT